MTDHPTGEGWISRIATIDFAMILTLWVAWMGLRVFRKEASGMEERYES